MSGKGNKRATGDIGEEAVCRMLEQQGAEILCRNFTIRGGEIDIIASYGMYILFVEVKARRVGTMATGMEAVDARKQMHIIRTAEAYLQRNPMELQPRFDVAEVEIAGGMVRRIEYIAQAFDATDYYH